MTCRTLYDHDILQRMETLERERARTPIKPPPRRFNNWLEVESAKEAVVKCLKERYAHHIAMGAKSLLSVYYTALEGLEEWFGEEVYSRHKAWMISTASAIRAGARAMDDALGEHYVWRYEVYLLDYFFTDEDVGQDFEDRLLGDLWEVKCEKCGVYENGYEDMDRCAACVKTYGV